MVKILGLLLLALVSIPSSKDVATIGFVTPYYKHTLNGEPYMVCLSVISDVEYAYYIVPDTTSPLLKHVGQYVKFTGKAYQDSTTLNDGGLKHWLIKNVEFDVKK